jgi:hypothetical protein
MNWKETLVDWVGARWRWLIVAVVLLFAFNNLVGLVVGITGLIAFANSVVGRVLRARRVVQQVQQIVIPMASEKRRDPNVPSPGPIIAPSDERSPL